MKFSADGHGSQHGHRLSPPAHGTHLHHRKPGTHPCDEMPHLEEVSRASSLRSSSETTLDTSSECGGGCQYGVGPGSPVIWWKWYPFWPMATIDTWIGHMNVNYVPYTRSIACTPVAWLEYRTVHHLEARTGPGVLEAHRGLVSSAVRQPNIYFARSTA
jgi:hypothetical protein